MSPPMSLSCSRAAVHAGRPTDYVKSGRRPPTSPQHPTSAIVSLSLVDTTAVPTPDRTRSLTPDRTLPIAHVRSIPPVREGGPHRMRTDLWAQVGVFQPGLAPQRRRRGRRAAADRRRGARTRLAQHHRDLHYGRRRPGPRARRPHVGLNHRARSNRSDNHSAVTQ